VEPPEALLLRLADSPDITEAPVAAGTTSSGDTSAQWPVYERFRDALVETAPMDISLREVEDRDLPIFWQQLTDPESQQMAAVTRKYHYDRGHFDQHWAKVRSDSSVILRTVLADGVAAGHAAVFGPPQEREVTYVIRPAGAPAVGRELIGARGSPTRPLPN
jgi:hypothetical protein